MIQLRSIVKSATTPGQKIGARFGEVTASAMLNWNIVSMSVKEAVPHSNVKKGDVVHGVVVRTKKKSGAPTDLISFDDNAVVLIDAKERNERHSYF